MSLSVKLFTHTDLDGVGCSVVGQVVFGSQNVDVEYCNYNDINERVELFLDNGGCAKYGFIFITDISVSEDVAERINRVCPNQVVLLDHHDTAKFLNKYEWAEVDSEEYDPYTEGTQKSSGTSAFYNWVRRHGMYMPTKEETLLGLFVEAVRQYDTWEWKNRFNSSYPKELNDLLMLTGRYSFVNRWVKSQRLTFTESERMLLEVEKTRRDRYLYLHTKSMKKITTEEGYKVGVVFAETYQSELGNKLAEENPDLDFIAMINMSAGSVSYRANRGTVHLGEYAKERGGGGHPAAAGAPIDSKILGKVVFGLMNNKW